MSAYEGVRVVDFSQGLAGPMAAMFLGDFGAEVVKVEPPGGDRWKNHPGYLAWNRNKQVLTLEPGSTVALDLIAGADVALFDHSPAELRRLGLDGETLTAAHPRLVHAWMPPYGTGGRWSELPARHNLLMGLTGQAFRQGAWEDVPVHFVLPVLHYGQAMMGALAIGAALCERSRSGRGQAIVASGLHGAAEVQGLPWMKSVPIPPRAIPPGVNPRYRLYECSDGEFLFLGTLFDNFYKRFLDFAGVGDLFDVLEADMEAAQHLFIEVFKTRPRDEWLAELKARDIPAAPAGERQAWFDSPIVRDGLRTSFEHPVLGEVAMPTPPARLSATPASIRGLPRAVETAPAWPRNDRVPPMPARSGGPLAGIRVLNLGMVIAGTYSGTLLANLGADVIKIEPPGADPFRSDQPVFFAYNRGQRGLGLDLKQPGGRELFLELARSADVVIDNYRQGVRARLGIDYADLKAVNPRIISCSFTGYGETGPRAKAPGYDPLLQAESGMMRAQGGDGEPIFHTMAVNDVAGAATVAVAVMAALHARERTGEGQDVRASLAASSLLFQLGEVTSFAGRPANLTGGRDCAGTSALVRFYRCGDGEWLGVNCESEDEASAAGRALGIDLPERPLAESRDGPLAAALEAALSHLSRDEAVARLVDAGAPAAPAVRYMDAFESPWLWEQGYLDSSNHPRLGEFVSVRGFADFARTPGGFVHPTPECGEHTREVLAEYGVPVERIDELFASGVVFDYRPPA